MYPPILPFWVPKHLVMWLSMINPATTWEHNSFLHSASQVKFANQITMSNYCVNHSTATIHNGEWTSLQ
jgi:hypothetical protein